jgi:hypothetical protein
MPGKAPQTRAERKQTATLLLAAAKKFFGDIMGNDSGRRSETDMSAFYAALAAMMRLTNVRFQQGIPRRTRGTVADWYKNNEFTLSDDAYQILLNSL